MNKIKRFFEMFRKYIYSIAFLLIVFLFCFTATNLSDYKIEKAFNNFFANTNYQYTYLSVSNKNGNDDNFKSLYYSFFWTSLSANSRRRVNDTITANSNDKSLEIDDVGLFFQDYFTLEKNEYAGERYYLHDGMFFTYFDNNPVPVNSVRFGCDGFVLISDVFADLLLEKYAIPNEGFESYRNIIDDEEKSKLTYSFSNGKSITLCINNVIDSSKRVGARLKDEIPIFGLTYYKYVKDLPLCFEGDFKGSGYSPKAFVDRIFNSGYDLDKTNYSLIKKDGSGHYIKDESNSAALVEALSAKRTDTFPTVILYVLSFGVLGSTVFLCLFTNWSNDNKKENRIAGMIIGLLSILLITIQQFASLYYLFSLVPVIFLVTWGVCLVIKIAFKRKGADASNEYIEIYI